MTDLDLIKRCAEKMGLFPHTSRPDEFGYNPITDDAQAMALAKHFMLTVDFFAQYAAAPISCREDIRIYFDGEGETANRAIVECVARMP